MVEGLEKSRCSWTQAPQHPLSLCTGGPELPSRAVFSRLPVLPKQTWQRNIRNRGHFPVLYNPLPLPFLVAWKQTIKEQGLLKSARSPLTLMCQVTVRSTRAKKQRMVCLLLDGALLELETCLCKTTLLIYTLSHLHCRMSSAVVKTFVNFIFLHDNYSFLVFCKKNHSKCNKEHQVRVLTSFSY